MKRVLYETEWIWQAKIDITVPSKSTEIMRMNESLELDVHRAGIRQSPVFTRVSPQTDCDFPELRNVIIFLILLNTLRIFSLLSSPNKKFKMTNNKSRTQNARVNIMTHSCNDPHFGESHTNQKSTVTWYKNSSMQNNKNWRKNNKENVYT